MIIGQTQVENPDDIRVTMTLTMSFKEWKEVAAKMDQAWPSWCLASVIRQSIRDIEKVHYQKQDYHSP